LQEHISQKAESYNPVCRQPEKASDSSNSGRSRLIEWFFTPVLAPLLQNRWPIIVIAAAGIVQLVLIATGLNGWQCPIRSTFGVTCPGCGLSTAITLLAKGYWVASLQMHVFAPLFLLALIFLVVAIALPAGHLKAVSAGLAALERKTGPTAIVTLAMVFYWLLRVFNII